MNNNFLAINKEYLGCGLKSIDLLIIAQVEEFERNGCECYVTNQQFVDMFGESISTIKRSIDKLEEKGILVRDTYFLSDNGQKSKQRTLKRSKVHIEPTLFKARFTENPACDTESKLGSKNNKQGSNIEEARFKNEPSKVHNEPTKDNIKDNIKENIKDNIFTKNDSSAQSEDCSMSHEPKARSKNEYSLFGGLVEALPKDADQNTSNDYSSLSWNDKVNIIDDIDCGLWDDEIPFWVTEYKRIFKKRLKEAGNPHRDNWLYTIAEENARQDLDNIMNSIISKV